MSDPLETILALATIDGGTLTHDDVTAWPDSALPLFEEVGVLVRLTDALHVVCDQCADRHTADVIERVARNGESLLFHHCPEAGRVPLTADRLRQWRIDCDRLADATASALGADDSVECVLPQRFWRLGTVTIDDRVLAAAMMRVPAGATPQLDSPPQGIAPEKTVLFVLGTTSLQGSAPPSYAAVIPLNRALRLNGGQISARLDRITTSIDESVCPAEELKLNDAEMTVTFRGRSCKFSGRAKDQWTLLKRLARRHGQRVSFHAMKQPNDIYGEYPVEDSSIRSAVQRLRVSLSNSGMKKLANCLKTGGGSGDPYATIDLSSRGAK